MLNQSFNKSTPIDMFTNIVTVEDGIQLQMFCGNCYTSSSDNLHYCWYEGVEHIGPFRKEIIVNTTEITDTNISQLTFTANMSSPAKTFMCIDQSDRPQRRLPLPICYNNTVSHILVVMIIGKSLHDIVASIYTLILLLCVMTHELVFF